MHRSLYRLLLLLLLCFYTLSTTAQVAETPLEQHIRAVYKLLQERRANHKLQGQDLYDQLKDTANFKLPVGIGGNDNGQPPVIIDSIRFLPDHAEVTAYLVVQLPGTDRELMFAASSIPITRKGGLVGTARLELVNDQPLNLFGDSTAVIIQHGKTFAEFDCNGFKRLGIGAEIQLSPKLVKGNADGTQNLDERVKGYFETQASDLNDIIATVNIEPFQIRGAKGVTFTVQDAVIDLSDYHNSAGMVFPAEYNKLYSTADLPLWRGFCLRNFTVTLPDEIKDNKQKGQRKSFSVRNALIDERGFSGELLARNLIPLESGDMGGWAFSIEEFRLGFVANQFKYGSLAGGINVPITGDTTQFAYTALFHPGVEYVFTIQPSKEVSFEIFQAAHVTLEKSSFLEVAVKNKAFQVAANLTGTLSIGGSVKGDDSTGSAQGSSNNLAIPDIRFEQLVISTQAPFIHSGTFSLSGNTNLPKLGGYTLSVDAIQFVKDGEERGLGFDVHLNLMGGNSAFAADASLAILGKVNNSDGRYHFRYSRIWLSRIAIDVDQGPFALRGSLLFFNENKIYGNGFRGDIDARIRIGKSSGGIRVGVTALFGSVNDSRYWYADALAEFPGAIPILPPVMAKGFGGGLYYGVKQISVKEMQAGTAGYEIGTTRTGVTYKPDPGAGLGIKASMNFVLSNEKVLNGIVGFEMAFNRSGGVSRITFRGQCNVLTAPIPNVLDKIKTKYAKVLEHVDGNVSQTLNDNTDANGQIAVDLLVDADFENGTLYSDFKAYINIAGGVIRGVGPNGLAGEGVMYAGPDGWYLHVGSPSNPIGIELLGLARSHAYFMVGKDLPGSPPPPPNVQDILGGMNLDYMRDLNALAKGNGFAFGAGLDFDTGDMTFLIFYARLAAGIGFDIMLKNYGEGVHCEGGNGPIGINGWYANGQVYAYFQGKIGIKVNLFLIKGRFDIIDLGAAVVLQGKLPNPTWMRGVVGGHFSILGGLVSGDCRFEVTLGKECRIVGNNLFAEAGVQVIADATPHADEGDVNVFNTPQLVFNMPIGKTFNITDGDNKVHSFRARMEYFNLRDGGTNIDATQEWNADNTTVVLNTPEVLPSQKKLRLTARVTFEENVNGSWSPYLINNQPYAEAVDNEFATGVAPDVIVPSNVAYAYPVQQQLNYYKDESHQGYIILKKGQGYLFNAGTDFKQIGRIAIDGAQPLEFDLQYNSGKINFTVPDGIRNDKAYSLSLVNTPVTSNTAIDRNVSKQDTQVASGDAGTVTLQTKKTTGGINSLQEKVMYNYLFRSSRYSTFSEKIDHSPLYSMFTWPIRNAVYEFGYVINNQELFDEQEVDASGNSKVLQFEALLDDNVWYQQYIYPYVYADYGTSPYIYISWRNIADIGAPPVKGIYLRQSPNALQLQQGGQTAYNGLSGFIYNLPHYIERDYVETQSAIANAYIHQWIPVLSDKQAHMISTPFTPAGKGNYRFRIKYVLPGINTVTSVKELTIQNNVDNH
ncbi:hypothetical protein CLV51_106126 [Chitinophaga niastensis]|uniref:Uncharacterized protein n=1 Tax=Chitinophaga niastensis TaxID=536980 RepID=A0A2P8HDG0_CHINA|nr:hypothetical protein [Chitinophaga niastensis]PSL44260.1 hypothetical protein CLV51_106126 [Chitinophaga niastensis]